MATEQELFTQVESAVREVLNTDEGEIKQESMFRADLGAESIDLLDISFELEKLTGKELDFREVVQFGGQVHNSRFQVPRCQFARGLPFLQGVKFHALHFLEGSQIRQRAGTKTVFKLVRISGPGDSYVE